VKRILTRGYALSVICAPSEPNSHTLPPGPLSVKADFEQAITYFQQLAGGNGIRIYGNSAEILRWLSKIGRSARIRGMMTAAVNAAAIIPTVRLEWSAIRP
jgi:hypothetical protein